MEPHSTRKQDSIALLGSSPYNDGDNVQPVRHLSTIRDSVPDNNNTVTIDWLQTSKADRDWKLLGGQA